MLNKNAEIELEPKLQGFIQSYVRKEIYNLGVPEGLDMLVQLPHEGFLIFLHMDETIHHIVYNSKTQESRNVEKFFSLLLGYVHCSGGFIVTIPNRFTLFIGK
jgi:hypothetical protein